MKRKLDYARIIILINEAIALDPTMTDDDIVEYCVSHGCHANVTALRHLRSQADIPDCRTRRREVITSLIREALVINPLANDAELHDYVASKYAGYIGWQSVRDARVAAGILNSRQRRRQQVSAMIEESNTNGA